MILKQFLIRDQLKLWDKRQSILIFALRKPFEKEIDEVGTQSNPIANQNTIF
jgi:hypothetical protein